MRQQCGFEREILVSVRLLFGDTGVPESLHKFISLGSDPGLNIYYEVYLIT